jgi:SAM-dependent methyltransferase
MQRWRSVSTDPNDPDLMESRRRAISKARTGRLVFDRVAYLCELVVGKSVLDVGVVDHTRDASHSRDWLHGHLERHAARCVGVDVLEDDVAYLVEQGHDIVLHDLQRSPLDSKFDLIVVGEVLEHLDAPGLFMKHCAAMLDPGGRLALTVPNPWYVNAIWKSCRRRHTFVDSADHVAWYEPSTLFELGQRHGFRLDRFSGIAVTNPQTPQARLFFALRPLLIRMGVAPEVFGKSVLYEFVRL